MVRHKTKLYDDHKECLTRSSFTTFYSGFRHVPRGSTEIAIDFCGREKIVSLVLPLDEYICWQIWIAVDNMTTSKDAGNGFHLLHSIRKLDRPDALYAQLKYQYQWFSVLVLFPRTGVQSADPPLIRKLSYVHLVYQLADKRLDW